MKMISLFWGKVGLEKSFAELFFFFEQGCNLLCSPSCLKLAILLPLPSELVLHACIIRPSCSTVNIQVLHMMRL